jgi:hypothetical protein
MIKSVIGNGGHSSEVMDQMGIKLVRFVNNQYINIPRLVKVRRTHTKTNRE